MMDKHERAKRLKAAYLEELHERAESLNHDLNPPAPYGRKKVCKRISPSL